jgi:hypothetical protein
MANGFCGWCLRYQIGHGDFEPITMLELREGNAPVPSCSLPDRVVSHDGMCQVCRQLWDVDKVFHEMVMKCEPWS